MSAATQVPPPAAGTAGLLCLVACGMFMQTLDGTIVITALPAMARSLHADPLGMHAVISAYLVAMAVLIPASGWLADRHGTRTVYACALAAFTAGSVLCAAAHSLPLLIAARVIQGAGGALLLPVGRLAVLRAVPPSQLVPAMSAIAVPALIGPMLGPALGGWLVETASWRWIFLVNVPVGAACIVAALLILPRGVKRDGRRDGVPGAELALPFDAAGYLMLAGAMAALAMGFEALSDRKPDLLRMALWSVAGAAALAAYIRHAGRCRHPLFPLARLLRLNMRVALGGNLCCRLGNAGMPFLLPLLMQLCMGYGPSQAGLMMLPVALMGMAVKPVAGPLIARAGYRRVLLANTAILGAALCSVALLRPGQAWWVHALPLACFGAANSLQLTAMNTLALKDLKRREAGSGTSLLSMVQILAMGLGIALSGGLLAMNTRLANGAPLDAFRLTFAMMGMLTLASSAVFLQLPPRQPPTPNR